MQPSTQLCQTRAAHHRALAAASDLDNVRTIALNAASAWDKEGLLAEKREARMLAGKSAGLDADDADDAQDAPAPIAGGPECD